MAAVTVTARSYKANAAGALTHKMWNITGNDTNTFDTGIKSVRTVAFFIEPNNIVTAVAQSTVNGQIRLTFSATGAFANMDLLAILRNG